MLLLLGVCSGSAQPAVLVSAPTFKCTGFVVDIHAQPIVGARLDCYKAPEGNSLSSSDPVLEQVATTDATGRFELRVSFSPKILVAQKTGLAPTWTCATEPGEREWRLVLPPPGEFSGLVLDKDKRPVANAEVWTAWVINERGAVGGRYWESILSGSIARKSFSTRTSADGRFRISGFPSQSSALLAARKPGLASLPTSSSSESWFAGGVSGRAGRHDIQITVEPTGSIEGRVAIGATDPFLGRDRVMHPGEPGQPAPNTAVVLTPVSETWAETAQVSTTSADGVFRFTDVAAGQYRLADMGGAAIARGLILLSGGCYLRPGEAVTNLVLRMVPAGTLVVNVRSSEDGRPVAAAVLSLNDQRFICDVNGSTTIRCPAGDCQVYVQKHWFQENGFHTNIHAGQTTAVDFKLVPVPKITGRILSPTGNPVPKAQVTAFIDQPTPDLETESKVDGTFALPWNTNWDRQVRPYSGVIVRDLTNGLASYVPLLKGIRQLTVNLEQGMKITGRVVDEHDQALQYIPVSATLRGIPGPMRVQFQAASGADGRFEIDALPMGHSYEIWPLVQGYRGSPARVPKTQTNHVEVPPIVVDSQLQKP